MLIATRDGMPMVVSYNNIRSLSREEVGATTVLMLVYHIHGMDTLTTIPMAGSERTREIPKFLDEPDKSRSMLRSEWRQTLTSEVLSSLLVLTCQDILPQRHLR